MNINKTAITKGAVSFVVKSGVTKIANSIIINNVNVQDANLYSKVAITSAALVIGMMAGDATKAYTDNKIDGIVAAFNQKDESETVPVTEPTE